MDAARMPARGSAGSTTAAASGVLHLVFASSDEIHGFLAPATRELSRMGRRQTVVLLDDAVARAHLPQLMRHARVVVAGRPAGPWARCRAFYAACCRELVRGRPATVHCHGIIACVIGALASRRCAPRAEVLRSPHGALASWGRGLRVESPVREAFLAVRRDEAATPLVLSGGAPASRPSVEVLSQIAVLLGARELDIAFEWLGGMDRRMAGCFDAAGIRTTGIGEEAVHAGELARGWLYLAPWRARGRPLFLVQALAAGLPVVVRDCPQHRRLVEHGRTGFLCGSEDELVEAVARLIDDPALRRRMGGAARDAARVRFGAPAFRAGLRRAYPSHPA